jgi:hypothetical protein
VRKSLDLGLAEIKEAIGERTSSRLLISAFWFGIGFASLAAPSSGALPPVAAVAAVVGIGAELAAHVVVGSRIGFFEMAAFSGRHPVRWTRLWWWLVLARPSHSTPLEWALFAVAWSTLTFAVVSLLVSL